MSDQHTNFGIDVDVLDTETLQREYQELNERRFSQTIEERGRARRTVVWNELRDRMDVEQPECPKCSEQRWGFSDHTLCANCDYAPVDDEILGEIQRGWEQIIHGGAN